MKTVRICLLVAAQAIGFARLHAANLWWDNGGGTPNVWGQVANWSTVSGAGTPDPAAIPGASDIAIFNITTLNSAQTLALNANRSAAGLQFNSTGPVTLNANTGSSSFILTLGTSGMTRASGAGNVTFGSTNGSLTITLAGSQTWDSGPAGGSIVLQNGVGSSTVTSTLTLTGSSTGNAIGVTGSTGGTIGQNASFPVSLVKNGSGTWTLAGDNHNTYTGGTTVNDGILVLAKAAGGNAIPGDLTLTGDALVQLNNDNQIADGFTLNLNGAATVLGMNTHDEKVGRLVGSGTVRNNNTTNVLLTLDSTSDASFSGNIEQGSSGTITVEKQNSNTVTWSGAGSTFTGELRVNNGKLVYTNDGAVGLGAAVRFGNAGTGGGDATLEYSGTAASDLSARTFTINKNDNHTATFLNNSAGAAASMTVGNLTSTGTGSVKIFTLDGSNTGANTVSGVVGGGSGANGGLQLTKAGSGTWILGGTAANVASGTVRVQGGILALAKPAGVNAIATTEIELGDGAGTDILRLDQNNQILDSARITFGQSTAVFRLNGRSETIASLAGSAGTVENAGGGTSTLTLNPTGSNSFGGVLQNGTSGTLALTKINTGTQTLSGSNTHSGVNILGTSTSNTAAYGAGATAGSGGFLVLGSNTALGTGTLDSRGTQLWSDNDARTLANPILLSSSGGLRFGGNNDLTLNGNMTVSGTVRAIGNYSNGKTLTLGGNINRSVQLNFESTSGNPGGPVVVNGSINGSAAVQVHLNFGSTVTFNNTHTYTGATQINSGVLRLTTGNEQSLGNNPGAFNAAQLSINGGALQVSGASLVINDSNRGITVGTGTSGGTFLVDPGLTLTVANPVNAGAINSVLTKAGAGTFNLTATGYTDANVLRVTGGKYVQSAGTTTIFTTVSGGLDIQAGEYELAGGTLRTDRVQGAGTFTWGSGRLTVRAYGTGSSLNPDLSPKKDLSSAGYQEVKQGTQLRVEGNLAGSAGSTLMLHGSPTLYITDALLFDNLFVTGNLTLNGGTLETEINPFRLRPVSPTLGPNAIESGSLPLVIVDGTLSGTFAAFTGVGDDGRGFSEHTGAFTSASALPVNTWFLEYRSGVPGSELYLPAESGFAGSYDVVFFHYKVAGYVPEPGTFGLGALGACVLRVLTARRRAGRNLLRAAA